MRYTYCPDCGSLLEARDLGDDKNVPWCVKCSKPWFDSFSTCVISLVYNSRNEVLLLKQDYISPVFRNLVSGYMQPGETAEAAALREVEEETGVKGNPPEFVGTYWFERKGLLMIGFLIKADSDELRLSAEVDGAEWVDAAKAVTMVHQRPDSTSNALCRFFLNRLGR